MPWTASPAALNDALLASAASPARAQAARSRVGFAEYVGRYREGWSAPRAAQEKTPLAIEPRWLQEPPSAPDRRPLAFFYEDGVVCGRASSLAGLRRYAFDPDSLYADTDQRVRSLIEALARAREKPKA